MLYYDVLCWIWYLNYLYFLAVNVILMKLLEEQRSTWSDRSIIFGFSEHHPLVRNILGLDLEMYIYMQWTIIVVTVFTLRSFMVSYIVVNGCLWCNFQLHLQQILIKDFFGTFFYIFVLLNVYCLKVPVHFCSQFWTCTWYFSRIKRNGSISNLFWQELRQVMHRITNISQHRTQRSICCITKLLAKIFKISDP